MNIQANIDGTAASIGDLSSGYAPVSFQSDDRVNVQFYKKSVLNPQKSLELGRPHHEAADYVRLQHPGEKDYTDRPVKEHDPVKSRWPNQWRQYQAKQEQIPAGSPVDLLFPTQPEIAANMHSIAVHTVEQLAHLTAEGLSQVGMGATQWQNLAINYLAQSKQGVGAHQFQKALADRDNKLAVQDQHIALLKRQVEMLMAKSKGISDEIVPNVRANMAEAHAASLTDMPLYTPDPVDFGMSDIPENGGSLAPPLTPSAPSGPLYDESAAEAEFQTAPTLTESPYAPEAKRRGRPPKAS